MAQTFFIDSDEEIISVIGHLRTSSEPENYFVFPKRSLVLQSAVNLRLFQREAEKQGKKIIIVSQDEAGRQLAERVGIPTKDYASEIGALRQESQSVSSPTSPQTLPAQANTLQNRSADQERVIHPLAPTSNHIGSDSFSPEIDTTQPVAPQKSLVQTIRPDMTRTQAPLQRLKIRDMSPQYQTTLNSMRDTVPRGTTTVAAPSSTLSDQRGSEKQVMRQTRVPVQETPGLHQDTGARNAKLERFFQRDTSDQGSPAFRPTQKSQPSSLPARTSQISSWKTFTFIFGALFLLALGGVAVYFLVPKATVIITPHEISRDVTAQYEGRTIAPIGDNHQEVVPVRKIEKTYSTKLSAEATGQASGGNQKSRGTIVISNEYSSDSQPLISTTRFETPDGKIFRLAESVTVPGMTIQNGKREPGRVEAIVIADVAGEAYNIAPTTFTVPGFQGSPKYTTFHAQSTKNFTGGGAGDNGMASITKEDINKSLQKLKEASKEEFLQALKQDLLPDERLIEDSLEIDERVTPSLPLIGSLGTSFDIEGEYTGKAFVVSEQALKEKLAAKNPPELEGVSFRVTDTTLTFTNVIPHYDENSVDFSVQATLSLESVIMQDALREELLGQNEEGIKIVLERHSEIKKIEVNFSPEFLFRSIPNSTKRVHIILEQERSSH